MNSRPVSMVGRERYPLDGYENWKLGGALAEDAIGKANIKREDRRAQVPATISDVPLVSDSDVELSNVLIVNIAWMQTNALKSGRLYDFSIGQQEVVGRITNIEWQADVATFGCQKLDWLQPDVVGRCRITLAACLPVTAANADSRGGDLMVIDRVSDTAVGVGQVYGPFKKTADRRVANVR